MSEGELLGRARIVEVLTELGRRLDRQGVHAEIYVVGGGAMALAYNRERVTRDIDAIFEPKATVYAEARRMADELGLPPDWLNDGVKGFLPASSDPRARTVLTAPGVSVGVASAEYLFAMKAAAARIEEDTEDLRLLAVELGITSEDQALALLERFYERARLTVKSQLVLEALFDEHEPAGEGDPSAAPPEIGER